MVFPFAGTIQTHLSIIHINYHLAADLTDIDKAMFEL
jgi:hypothetical protein